MYVQLNIINRADIIYKRMTLCDDLNQCNPKCFCKTQSQKILCAILCLLLTYMVGIIITFMLFMLNYDDINLFIQNI